MESKAKRCHGAECSSPLERIDLRSFAIRAAPAQFANFVAVLKLLFEPRIAHRCVPAIRLLGGFLNEQDADCGLPACEPCTSDRFFRLMWVFISESK